MVRNERKTAASVLLIALALPVSLVAQEVPRAYYSAPIGLTELDVLRVIIAPAPGRLELPDGLFCEVNVTVEILDAGDLMLLESFGTLAVKPGSSFLADHQSLVGAPPARQEVIVRTTIERKPKRESEEGSLGDICPLLGSIQVYDTSTGTTLEDASLGNWLTRSEWCE